LDVVVGGGVFIFEGGGILVAIFVFVLVAV
jgi:hypothetical protein